MFEKLTALDIMTQNYKWVHETDTLAKALSLLEGSTDVLLVLDQHKKYSGILTERMIIRSGLPREETKVKSLRAHAPCIKKHTVVQECARLMLENDVMNLPVFEHDELLGVIDDVRLLGSVASKLFGKKKVHEIMSKDMIILSPRDKISEVLRCFREFHISRMPIVDDGQIVGIITLHDIITKLLHARERATFGFILDEKRSLFNLPIENMMTYPALTCKTRSTVKEVINRIIAHNISGVIVVDDKQQLAGIITKRDLLEPLSQEQQDTTYPIIQINSKLGNINRDELRFEVKKFIEKYEKHLIDTRFYLYLRKHKETSKGENLIYARCRMFSSYGRFFATAEGWGERHAVKNALLLLDRQINKKISKQRTLSRDEKHKLMEYVEIESLS